jgi:four helix bundle protein
VGKPHQQLDAWKVGMALVKTTYEITAVFPVEERFGLAQQMRRAAVSIPSNLAEGAARTSPKEYAQFISIARGSMAELDTQLQIATQLGYLVPDHPVYQLADQVVKLLTGLHKKWTAQ